MFFKVSICVLVLFLAGLGSLTEGHGGGRGRHGGGPHPPSVFPPPFLVDFLGCFFNNTVVPADMDWTSSDAIVDLFSQWNATTFPCKKERGHGYYPFINSTAPEAPNVPGVFQELPPFRPPQGGRRGGR